MIIFIHPSHQIEQKTLTFWCVFQEQFNLYKIVQVSLHCQCCLALVDDYEEIIEKCNRGHCNCSL